jgi:hypothetical protein
MLKQANNKMVDSCFIQTNLQKHTHKKTVFRRLFLEAFCSFNIFTTYTFVMRKLGLAIIMLLSASFLFAQNLQSPEDFLGYKVGTHFTPHFKLLEYFKSVAAAKSDMVKLEKYGTTNEGRDLMLAYIALPENLQKLDAIRLNNLRISGSAKDKMAPVMDDAPVIVWLSYNVHGNEPASSEASMLTLFALVDPNNTQTKEWLKNTIVIIDPCINPDGRDRYANWYNSVVGTNYNVDPQSREHAEPWPGGRTNHYNFDLNRDWAWQTQKESQQRLRKYNEWLPEIHVDYHEQGYNQPYYFAPAAEPYHEVITPWQRDFQNMIGHNNAKYFDANGWLYFTRERFDLFYPSYGDTYPIYNGAIGMTFEQGGIRAGLGIITEDEDTLTLVDRAMHHFTTGMSTIETASKNAGKVLSEYKKFFDDTRNATGLNYKTFVLTSKDANRLQAVADLLDVNNIQYGITNAKSFHGYNYFTGKDENYVDEGYQLAVSTAQPKGRLAEVLFEPKSYLSDSATYDITAWSVPYTYGVKAYALKEKLDIAPYKPIADYADVQSDYGLLIPYNSFASALVLSDLIKQNVKVRYADKSFTYKSKNYPSGTLIVLKGNNINNWAALTNATCKKYKVQADIVSSGFMDKGEDFGSPDIRYIRQPKVALLTGEQVSASAAGEVWNFFDQTLHYPITLLNAENLNYYKLEKYNVIIMPDGDYDILGNKSVTDKLQAFVKSGGKIIAMENAVEELSENDWGFKSKDDDENKKDTGYALLKKFSDKEKGYLSSSIPGAIYKVELDNTHPLAFGYDSIYFTLKQDSKLYAFMKDGWNVGIIKQPYPVAGFVGNNLKPVLKDGTVIGVKEYGRGNIIFFADDIIFRQFWHNGKQMLVNAVFLVGQ